MTPKMYEYLDKQYDMPPTAKELNKFTQDKWELVNIIRTGDEKYIAYFKRTTDHYS